MALSDPPIGKLAFPVGGKTKTGNLAAPRFSAFFAVAALISASGGTHRVRGVMAAIGVLSPVES
jgi:hypothetical protein